MGLAYRNLDAETRRLMVEEIDFDVAAGPTYTSSFLTDKGAQAWIGLLRQAAQKADDVWLANQLRAPGILKHEAEKKKPTGGTTLAKVPFSAPETMAEGEFNRFYIRAVCRRALDGNNPTVIVYRARSSGTPRVESNSLIGQAMDAAKLLADLRASNGIDSASGLAKPNSGISVHLP